MSEIDETLEICPQCNTDLRPYLALGSMPSFCLQCRFPLMTIAGKYRLLATVGQGAVGTAYLARHLKLRHNADRVVKVIKEEMLKTHTTVQRFMREVQVTAELSERNDHIVRIYDDFGELPRLGYYYVMEFIRGESVRKYIQSQTHLPSLDWCVDIMGQLSDALHTAHAAGVIHRDLKPDNMMLTQKGSHPYYLKVLDWGIAKPLADETDAHLTQGLVGTPHYMAPEQAMNQRIDARSDIYAMAVILYELLTGVNPFVAATGKKGRTHDSMVDLINAQLYLSPPTFTEILPQRQDISPALEAVIFKALSKNPAQRYSTVLEFWQAIQESTGMSSTTPTSHITGSFKGSDFPSAPSSLIPTGNITGSHVGRPSTGGQVDSTGAASSQVLVPSVRPGNAPLAAQDSWQETVVHHNHPSSPSTPSHRSKFVGIGLLLVLILSVGGWGWYQSRSQRQKTDPSSQRNTQQHGISATSQPSPRLRKTGDSASSKQTDPDPKQQASSQTVAPVLRQSDNPTNAANTRSSNGTNGTDDTDDTDDTNDADTVTKPPKSRQGKSPRKTVPRKRRVVRPHRRTVSVRKVDDVRSEPAPPRLVHLCGDPGWIVVDILPSLQKSAEVTAEGGNWKRLSSRRFCVSASTRLLSIVQEGYDLCAFSVPSRKTLRVRLWESGKGGLSASSCLRP